MTHAELLSLCDEIQARADAATEGPWLRSGMSVKAPTCSGYIVRASSWPLGFEQTTKNGEFIAAARTDIPRLVAAVRELVGRVSDAAEALEEFGQHDLSCRQQLGYCGYDHKRGHCYRDNGIETYGDLRSCSCGFDTALAQYRAAFGGEPR